MGIVKEKNGKYRVSYSKRHPETRVPVRLAKRGIKTRAEAKRVERELIVRVEDRLRKAVVPVWKELVLKFMESNTTRQAKTMENYFLCIKAHTFEPWGDRIIDTVTTQEIRQLIDSKSDKSPSHRKNLLKFIR